MKRLATYDVVNGTTEIYDTVFNASLGENINIRTQFGSDSGLSQFHSITTDGLNGNSKLTTNRAYYYAVTAYGYNEDGIPKTLESSPVYLTVRPEVPNTMAAGETTASAGDMVSAAHDGPSQGSVDMVVVDPSKLTGHDYAVTFDDLMPDGTVAVNWTLTDVTDNVVLIANNPVVGGVNTATGLEVGPGGTPVVHGFQVQVNGPQEDLLSVSEWDHGWKENGVERDPAVSYVPWASLGRTGYIIENRAGEAYALPYTRDFDRFNYWESDDVELDFSTPSLGWDYLSESVVNYAPFSAYRHNFATGVKEPLFASWWEYDGDGTFNLGGFDGHSSGGVGPVYGAQAWEPIYAFVSQTGTAATWYDPAKDTQYITDNDLTASGGIGWASGGWSNTTTSGAAITYPYMTATLFTDYLGSGVLPTQAGFEYWGGYTTASSVVWQMSKPNSSADEKVNVSAEEFGLLICHTTELAVV
jgi:hypothetical protein